MEARGGDLPADRHVLRELREFGSSIKLFEESAREVVKEYSRRHVERGVQAAIDAWKAPGACRTGFTGCCGRFPFILVETASVGSGKGIL